MPRNFRIIFEIVLCALIFVLAWQNVQLRSQLTKLNESIAAEIGSAPELAATPTIDQAQLQLNESDKRELMRLRAELTRLKNIPRESPKRPVVAPRLEEPAQATLNEGVFPNQTSNFDDAAPTTANAITATATWNRVKIGQAGSITLDGNVIGTHEFIAECERVKAANGGFVLFIESASGALNPAQIETMQKITETQVALRLVTKESELH